MAKFPVLIDLADDYGTETTRLLMKDLSGAARLSTEAESDDNDIVPSNKATRTPNGNEKDAETFMLTQSLLSSVGRERGNQKVPPSQLSLNGNVNGKDHSNYVNGNTTTIHDVNVVINGHNSGLVSPASRSGSSSPTFVRHKNVNYQSDLWTLGRATPHSGSTTSFRKSVSPASTSSCQSQSNYSIGNNREQPTEDEHARIAVCSALLHSNPGDDDDDCNDTKTIIEIHPTTASATACNSKPSRVKLANGHSLRKHAESSINSHHAPNTSSFCDSASAVAMVCNDSQPGSSTGIRSISSESTSTLTNGDCLSSSVVSSSNGGGKRADSADLEEPATERQPMLPQTPGHSHTCKNRICTSFRLKLGWLKNPVDACLLPNKHIAIADYDNGFVVVDQIGEIVQQRKSGDDRNALGIACAADDDNRLFVLIFRAGEWMINVYANYSLVEILKCPRDGQIESWALRKIVIASGNLYLMASGESRCCVWSYDLLHNSWRALIYESSRKGVYNDISVLRDVESDISSLLLCDMKKSQLSTFVLNDKGELLDQRSIRVRKTKGQEWIVQGPNLAVLDEASDILVYDTSGKLFLFDGQCYKCKKIVADVGRGEVSSVFAKHGWVYVLCRYRLCIEAYMYREDGGETSL